MVEEEDKEEIMIINGIKLKEVKQKDEFYACKGCIFYNPKLFKEKTTICEAPDDVICHLGMIFVKDE